MMKKHVIWSNINLDLKDWEDLFDYYWQEDGRILTEDEKYEAMYETNDEYLEDERMNMDKDVEEDIIAIGSLGLWHGRVMGYKEIGNNLKDCLSTDCDYVEWYVDGRKNFRMTGHHHDGTNYVLYRMWKEGLSTEQKDNFLDKIWRGKATMKDVSRYTRRLGDVIGKIYGW